MESRIKAAIDSAKDGVDIKYQTSLCKADLLKTKLAYVESTHWYSRKDRLIELLIEFLKTDAIEEAKNDQEIPFKLFMAFLSEKNELHLISIKNLECRTTAGTNLILRWQQSPFIPSEIYDYIINFLDEKSLISINRTCRFFNSLLAQNKKFKQLQSDQCDYTQQPIVKPIIEFNKEVIGYTILPNGNIAVATDDDIFFIGDGGISIHIIDLNNGCQQNILPISLRNGGNTELITLNDGDIACRGDEMLHFFSKFFSKDYGKQDMWAKINIKTGEYTLHSQRPSGDVYVGFDRLPSGDYIMHDKNDRTNPNQIIFLDHSKGEEKHKITVEPHPADMRHIHGLKALRNGNILCVYTSSFGYGTKICVLQFPKLERKLELEKVALPRKA